RSIDVKYAGKPLQPQTRYAWKVRTWNRAGDAGDFSAPQTFTTADKLDESQVAHYAIETTDQPPARIIKKSPGHFFLDFDRDGFGFLTLDIDSPDARDLEIHLGEMADGESINRKPPGSIRHAAVSLAIQSGRHTYRVQTPADKKNTSEKAIHLPMEFGVV